MNKEYVIDPTAFHTYVELRYALEKFGFSQGRLLVKYPSAWIKSVYEQIQFWPDIEKHRAKELLVKAKEMLVPAGESYETSITWLNNAHNIFNDRKVDGVIASDVNSWGYPTIAEIDDDYFESGRDIRTLSSAESYIKVSLRLLQMSHEVTFIDPYLRLDKKGYAIVFNEFLKVAQQGKCKLFVIWARYGISEMKSQAAYSEMLAKDFKSTLNKGSKLHVKLVDDANSIEKMHARLMLSRLGGFRFDHGFEAFSDNRNVDISILDKNTLDHHCKWYLDPDSRNDFKVIEEHLISV
jgi:hypothetical protein